MSTSTIDKTNQDRILTSEAPQKVAIEVQAFHLATDSVCHAAQAFTRYRKKLMSKHASDIEHIQIWAMTQELCDRAEDLLIQMHRFMELCDGGSLRAALELFDPLPQALQPLAKTEHTTTYA